MTRSRYIRKIARRLPAYLPATVWALLVLMPLFGVVLSVRFHMA